MGIGIFHTIMSIFVCRRWKRCIYAPLSQTEEWKVFDWYKLYDMETDIRKLKYFLFH